jgi:hypothetical protein
MQLAWTETDSRYPERSSGNRDPCKPSETTDSDATGANRKGAAIMASTPTGNIVHEDYDFSGVIL